MQKLKASKIEYFPADSKTGTTEVVLVSKAQGKVRKKVSPQLNNIIWNQNV